MRSLGIIQPGRLGDIIICLPLARWYFERGYKVVWPIESSYLPNFVGYVDYVEFVAIKSLNCSDARQICFSRCNTILDISITLPQSHPINDEFFYKNRCKIGFDQMKYLFSNVPFEEKWNLKFNRNLHNEKSLMDELNINSDPFTLVHTHGSNESFEFRTKHIERVVVVEERTPSIFDWCGVIEMASRIVAIDSSFANLVEQFGYDKPKHLVRRSSDVRPTYKNWRVIR